MGLRWAPKGQLIAPQNSVAKMIGLCMVSAPNHSTDFCQMRAQSNIVVLPTPFSPISKLKPG